MTYVGIFIVAVVVGLAALRAYVWFDERRLKRDARRRGDRP